ncbi:MAG: GTP pyrophosphokinase, partial [Ornithinimicrobium sp.]
EKAQRRDDSLDGDLLFPDPATQITDQIGIRVITFVHSDVAAVADLLAAQMTVLDDRDMGQETAREGRFGYASRHVLVAADADAVSVKGHRASVQVRTVLQHAWAEFEHDIRYKGTVPTEHVPDLDRRFTLAAGLLELADREFSTIRDRLQETMSGRPSAPDDDDPRISAQDLASFLAGRFADAGWSRSEHYAWISGLLLELDVTSLDELGALLAAVDLQVVNAGMDYRYPPGAVRRLDDALLYIFGQRYMNLSGNSERRSALEVRSKRLRDGMGDRGRE